MKATELSSANPFSDEQTPTPSATQPRYIQVPITPLPALPRHITFPKRPAWPTKERHMTYRPSPLKNIVAKADTESNASGMLSTGFNSESGPSSESGPNSQGEPFDTPEPYPDLVVPGITRTEEYQARCVLSGSIQKLADRRRLNAIRMLGVDVQQVLQEFSQNFVGIASNRDILKADGNIALWRMANSIHVLGQRLLVVRWAIQNGDPYFRDVFLREHGLLQFEHVRMCGLYRSAYAHLNG